MILNIENLVEVLPFEDDYAIFIVKDGSFGVLNCDGEVTILLSMPNSLGWAPTGCLHSAPLLLNMWR